MSDTTAHVELNMEGSGPLHQDTGDGWETVINEDGHFVGDLRCYKVRIGDSYKRNVWAHHEFEAITLRFWDYISHTTPNNEIESVGMEMKMNGSGVEFYATLNGQAYTTARAVETPGIADSTAQN